MPFLNNSVKDFLPFRRLWRGRRRSVASHLIGYRQPAATLGATSCDYFPPVPIAHTRAVAVFVPPLAIRWLICSLHFVVYIVFM